MGKVFHKLVQRKLCNACNLGINKKENKKQIPDGKKG